MGVSCERANLIIAWLEIAELGACLSSNLLKWRANQSVNSGWAHEPRPASGRIEAGLGEQNRDCQFHLRDTSRVLRRAEMWYTYSIPSSCQVAPRVLAAMRLDLCDMGCIHDLDQAHPTHLSDGSHISDMKAAFCLSRHDALP